MSIFEVSCTKIRADLIEYEVQHRRTGLQQISETRALEVYIQQLLNLFFAT